MTDTPGHPDTVTALNRHCHCELVDATALRQALAREIAQPGLIEAMQASHPHLFSPTAVFVAQADVARMRAIVEAVERVVTLETYREQALGWSPDIARLDPGARGSFLGYDFHLGAAGPQLIEINTNAGGALLNSLLARATLACCPPVERATPRARIAHLDDELVEMFRAELRAHRGDARLANLAIVDDDPTAQYLYPEFRLFESLLRRHGVNAVILDARELVYRDGRLYGGGQALDLVYNRLTDFAFDDPAHAALRAAYLAGDVTVTPHPRAHALYAHKRNLTLLSDPAFLGALDLPADIVTTLLGGIPRTVLVTPDQADTLWSARRDWFFKPVAGFGGRAAYSGEKITRRVFEDVLRGGYVAQRRAEAPPRASSVVGDAPSLKFDLRCYVYAGKIQLLAARLYRGQTTNFRTPGGGFAPVYEIP